MTGWFVNLNKTIYLHVMYFYTSQVTVESQVKSAVEFAKEKFGSLNVVVNCAGVGLALKTLGNDGKPHPLDKFERVLKVCINCYSVLKCF